MIASIVRITNDPDDTEGHDCGYCKSSDTSISDGLWALSLSCMDYQKLIDRGWRRSGQYLYKPRMKEICCPAYAIRLDVGKFEFSKTHKKVAKKFAKYLSIDNLPTGSVMESVQAIKDSPRLRLELSKSRFEKDSFELYCKYQNVIHKDPLGKLTESSYKRFLIDSPLNNANEDSDGGSLPMGSYHQKYYLDGTLIAVSVIDILPFCLSSVYVFYDPDWMHLGLGNVTALFEIYMVLAMRLSPQFHYYYMGFYIHNCEKMNYKAKFGPSDLCDPISYEWRPLSEWISKLDQSKFHSFSIASGPLEISETVRISYNGSIMTIPMRKLPPEIHRILQYLSTLLGADLMQSMIFEL